MKKLILGIGFTLLLVACGPSLEDVKVGMSESEVSEMLGKANGTKSNSSSGTINGETVSFSSSATWTYTGLGSIEFQDGVVTAVNPE